MLHEIIATLHNKLAKFQYLNYGGCGVVAERMYSRLAELGYEPKILCVRSPYDCQDVHLDHMRENISMNGKDSNRASNWTNDWGSVISFNHVILHINHEGEDVYFDSEGFIKIDWYNNGKVKGYGHMYRGELLISELRSFLKANVWNSTCRNHHNLGTVRSIITRTIRQFEAV